MQRRLVAVRSAARQPRPPSRRSWETERNEKCRTSIGCQARIGSRPSARARCGFPPRSSTFGSARWATFWCAWKIVALAPGRRGRRRRHGHALGEEAHRPRASAGNAASTLGRRRSARAPSQAPPSREPPRGHQNSSASVFRTQSAPKSVAASLAMRVTHSLWRISSPGSLIRCKDAGALVPFEDLRRSVLASGCRWR